MSRRQKNASANSGNKRKFKIVRQRQMEVIRYAGRGKSLASIKHLLFYICHLYSIIKEKNEIKE